MVRTYSGKLGKYGSTIVIDTTNEEPVSQQFAPPASSALGDSVPVIIPTSPTPPLSGSNTPPKIELSLPLKTQTLTALEEKREESDQSHEGYVLPVLEGSLPASRSRKQTGGQVYDVRTIRLRRGLLDAALTSSEHSEESTTTTTSLVLSNPSSGHGKGTSWRFVVPAALTPLDVREKSNSNKISLIPALLPETRPEWFRNFGRSFRVTRNLRSTSLTGFIGSCFYPEVRAVKKKKPSEFFPFPFQTFRILNFEFF